jgi:hypothetical protein
MNTEEKVQLLGEKQAELFKLFNSICGLIQDTDDKAEQCLKILTRFNQLFNRVAYLHNRVDEIDKVVGLDGSEPTVKRKRGYD